jgi:Family of unknown function (DUF6011)
MQGNPTDITTGEYTVAGRRYVARSANGQLRLHWVNSKGRVSRYAVAIVTGGQATLTGNGTGHAAQVGVINADPAAYRVQARCAGCHRILTDPNSIELGAGPVCATRRVA